jgi:1-acyl-sn-glycerol-3-phosphate acyltransferase
MSTGNGIIGRLARRIVRSLVRLYYPHIEISGAEHLPAPGPLLLAANHQNSLMDPVIVGIVARRPVRFLAKAPLFQIPIFGNILHALGMMPAYRRADDPTQTRRNIESLSLAAARLKDGDAVGIFPEGKSHDAPRLEQVKTGAARVAIQAVREGTLGLKLVPMGLNYERKEMFRSAVWVRVGEPIDVNAWLAQNDVEERQPVRELSAELDRRLKELVVHLDEESWEPLLNELEVLLPPPAESARNPFAWLRQRKRLADAINHFKRADGSRAEIVGEKLQQGSAHLAVAGLSARSSVLRWRGWRLAARLAWEALVMDLGFVLVLIGTLFHLLLFLLTRFVARFVQAPGRSTVALARFGVGIPFYGACARFMRGGCRNTFSLGRVGVAVPMPFAVCSRCNTGGASSAPVRAGGVISR